MIIVEEEGRIPLAQLRLGLPIWEGEVNNLN
jgi:hypothetical protein